MHKTAGVRKDLAASKVGAAMRDLITKTVLDPFEQVRIDREAHGLPKLAEPAPNEDFAAYIARMAEQELRDPPAVVANDERWSILLSADYTVQEMAAMMNGLQIQHAISVEALPLGDGVVMLRPMYPYKESPTSLQLIECMRVGAESGHRLVIR